MFYFVIAIALFVWLLSINNRVSDIEKELARKHQSVPVPSPPPPEPSPLIQTEKEHPSAVIPPEKAFFKEDSRETRIAADWLPKIGVLALLFGIGFSLKYAFDRGWISQWARIITGFITGGLLITLGEIWKEKYIKYAPVLTGGGIALLYFCTFAAYQYYNLIPQPIAFLLMAVVTIIAISLSYRYKSIPLAVLGISGVYLSPVLLHSGIDQQVNLFIYLTVLNIASLIVLSKNFWFELLLMSFLGTVLDYGLWAANYSTAVNTSTSLFFIVLTFALFIFPPSLLLRRKVQKGEDSSRFKNELALFYIFPALFYTVSLYVLLNLNFHNILFGVGMAGSLIAYFSYVLTCRLDLKRLNYSLAFLATALLTIAFTWKYDGSTLDIITVIIGLLSVAAGTLANLRELRASGLVVLFVSLFMVLFEPYNYTCYSFIFNTKFGLMLAQTIALLLAGWMVKPFASDSSEKDTGNLLTIVASLLFWFSFSWELVAFFRGHQLENLRNLYLSLWWIFYAAILLALGIIGRNSILRKVAICLFGLSIVKVFLFDVQNLSLEYRIVSFITLGVILLSVSFVYQKKKAQINDFLEGGKTN